MTADIFLPTVSLSSEPAIVSEGDQLFFNFELSEAAPEGGLTARLALLRDTDPIPGDIEYFVDGSTNINNFKLIRDENGSITNALVTISEGATTATLVSNVIDDGVAEPEESGTYALAAGSGYEIDPDSNSTSFTLTDFPVISLSTETIKVVEGDQLVFDFNLSQPVPEDGLTVRLSLLKDTDPLPGDIEYFIGDSVNITDFELVRDADGLITDALVTFASGVTEAKLVSDVIDDSVAEGVESVTYALADGSGYSIDPNTNEASFTILDDDIFIENAGFEEPALAEGDFTSDFVPGWDIYDPNNLVSDTPTAETSGATVFNPTTSYYSNEAPEGENVGDIFITQEPGSGVLGLSQTLDSLLTANTQYTLEVDVGNAAGSYEEFDLTGFPGYRVELLAGDIVLASEQNNLFIEEGTFGTSTVTFTATADSPYLGENLGIRLVSVLQGPGFEVSFDDVSLSTQAI